VTPTPRAPRRSTRSDTGCASASTSLHETTGCHTRYGQTRTLIRRLTYEEEHLATEPSSPSIRRNRVSNSCAVMVRSFRFRGWAGYCCNCVHHLVWVIWPGRARAGRAGQGRAVSARGRHWVSRAKARRLPHRARQLSCSGPPTASTLPPAGRRAPRCYSPGSRSSSSARLASRSSASARSALRSSASGSRRWSASPVGASLGALLWWALVARWVACS
jgi:hypothetical protein